MNLRRLLNVAYSALSQASDDVDELDRELESVPRLNDEARTPRPAGDLAALMAAARMPQVGGVRT